MLDYISLRRRSRDPSYFSKNTLHRANLVTELHHLALEGGAAAAALCIQRGQYLWRGLAHKRLGTCQQELTLALQ